MSKLLINNVCVAHYVVSDASLMFGWNWWLGGGLALIYKQDNDVGSLYTNNLFPEETELCLGVKGRD